MTNLEMDSNRAYSFDGVNNFISLANIASSQNQARSISCWINSNSDNPQCLISTGWTPVAGSTFNLIIKYPNGQGNIPGMGMMGYGNDCYPSNGQLISRSNWHFLTITYDQTTVRMYLNGIQQPTCSINLSTAGQNNFFGKSNDPVYPAFFNGKLDDICIWNRALDSAEITQLYQTQSTNSSSGNVGVNVVVPQRNLHIKDVIRLEPRTSAPDNPVFGDMYIDAVLKKLRVYDGTTWQNCW